MAARRATESPCTRADHSKSNPIVLRSPVGSTVNLCLVAAGYSGGSRHHGRPRRRVLAAASRNGGGLPPPQVEAGGLGPGQSQERAVVTTAGRGGSYPQRRVAVAQGRGGGVRWRAAVGLRAWCVGRGRWFGCGPWCGRRGRAPVLPSYRPRAPAAPQRRREAPRGEAIASGLGPQGPQGHRACDVARCTRQATNVRRGNGPVPVGGRYRPAVTLLNWTFPVLEPLPDGP